MKRLNNDWINEFQGNGKMIVKTIDIQGKEWFDRINGNSYHSARVIINYGMENEKTIFVPFQYGYGSQYQYNAFKALNDNEIIETTEKNIVPWQYCENNNIIMRSDIATGCLKRDTVSWGNK